MSATMWVAITLNIAGYEVRGWLLWGPEPFPSGMFIPAGASR